jgi:pantoate--beta-alanine ligase
MEIVRRIPQMKSLARKLRSEGRKVGFVPTMGALHAGHLSLMQAARQMSDVVVASIFINPIQFGANEDFEKYPRDLARDAEYCATRGVDYIFAPLIDEIYPEDFATYVVVEGLSEKLCGASREGHFRGVTTVVTKLLNIIHPHYAYFGRKDAQQAIIIKRMVRDLCLDSEIVVCPTQRDDDGLALSSRNAYLSPDERSRAVALPNALRAARDAIAGGKPVAEALRVAKQALVDAGFLRIDYLALVDAATLEPLDAPGGEMRLIAAASIGATRLIDNLPLMVESR